ncbi:50S ribosomal protein L25/general stress protein Ctc [Agrococcus casei]|uniref:Large ribosomal subunit protein bL25 n=1 Tax=Agrococcus casei LMG 22410 TaxID=1255656 RepID=A0A1R4F4F9_9MICO|nr:50S ribosomal protein L25/general stress protein Ctc [Agrococcus casei]SJM50775.1 LSU ribosomal protein L25p [Agrococcus casei LMG 22410]
MSSQRSKLVTEQRTEFGKGAARRLRAAGKVPAVLYGHGTEPQHLTLNTHELFLVVRRSNAIIDLDIEGASQLALVRDVQRNPVMMGADAIEHLDLIIVKRGEKVTVDVPVHLEGESAPGTISNLEVNTLSLDVDALNIPEYLMVSIEGLEEGALVTAADVTLPEGAELLTDAEQLVVGIIVPQLDTETTAGEDSAGEAEADDETDAEGDSE